MPASIMQQQTAQNEEVAAPSAQAIVAQSSSSFMDRAAGSVNPMNEYRARAVATRDHCLAGGRDAQSHGEDILWLMGWADNAIEVLMIDEGQC